jgi:hypothetical protein
VHEATDSTTIIKNARVGESITDPSEQAPGTARITPKTFVGRPLFGKVLHGREAALPDSQPALPETGVTGGRHFSSVGAAAGGFFISTNPDRSRWRTSRSAVILAMRPSGWWTRFLPSNWSATDRVWAIYPWMAGGWAVRRTGTAVTPLCGFVTQGVTQAAFLF